MEPQWHAKRAQVRGMGWYFAFFFLSGFCSLVFEIVWLRLAMAKFGVTTPLVSIVLSLFMAGLAIGSGFAGRLFRMQEDRPSSWFLRLYALAELLIGLSAFVVPYALERGRLALAGAGGSWGSFSYYLASGLLIGAAILPFCLCMGATFPLAMSSIRSSFRAESPRSFSYLYLANLLGACSGTLVSAFILIELFGFQKTLALTAALNGLVAAGAWALSLGAASRAKGARALATEPREAAARVPLESGGTVLLALLFLTGLASLAMEIVWVRQFTPHLGPLVYSFAAILAVYLAFNALGARLYRTWAAPCARATEERAWPLALIAVGTCALLPLLAADPRLPLGGTVLSRAARLILGVGPLCASFGFLTPLLVDRWAGGDPDRAGRAYAVNVLGCILGPLLAGFGLLPLVGERATLLAVSLPLLALGLAAALKRGRQKGEAAGRRPAGKTIPAAGVAFSCLLVFATKDYESLYPGRQIRRDYTATVIAAGEGMKKQLLINGYAITILTPITKMMAHLPAAFLASPPRQSLVICFGMGTSFRSLHSWGGRTTAVELVPSVPHLFGYYFADGPDLLTSPLTEIVIDDGRRFLERTTSQYDVITIDPPPPVEAAASSLLYSRDFYAVLGKRLRPGGIVQQWLPYGDPTVLSATSRALKESFPHVRAFRSVEKWGLHFLASPAPIPAVPAAALARRLPPRASADLLEWGPFDTAEKQFQAVLALEVAVDNLIAADPRAPTLEDDRPVNEYYLLRRTLAPARRRMAARS